MSDEQSIDTKIAVLTERLANAITERKEWQNDARKDMDGIFERLRLVEGRCSVFEEGITTLPKTTNGLNVQRIFFDFLKLMFSTLVAVILALKLTGKL